MMTCVHLDALAALVDLWRDTPEVSSLVTQLSDKLASGAAPFEGATVPDLLTSGKLPDGIASAWVFVLRPDTRTPAHRHPNSVQHMAVLAGAGSVLAGGNRVGLEPHTRLVVIPKDVPHAFDIGREALVVMSFHTAPPAELLEIEIASGAERVYVAPAASRQ